MAFVTRTEKQGKRTIFRKVTCSLRDVVGHEYIEGVCVGRAFLTGEGIEALRDLATEPVEFYPHEMHTRLVSLLPRVGSLCCPPMGGTSEGATSDAFRANSKNTMAPRSCHGYYRLAEDGRLHLSSKSAHYHASLGHGFPGYALVERAKRLGIPNATHNTTRGHVTRLVEEELVAYAGGIRRSDRSAMKSLLETTDATALNRVLNLETGSLAVEAALKMVLSRFHRVQVDSPEPKYQGRTPVILVLGDEQGGIEANYHGTTVLAQMMRGMWPGLAEACGSNNGLVVRAIPPGNMDALETAFREYNIPPYKIAGFFHELVMMNYAATVLSPAFVERAYALCDEHDVPAVVDEIQTCVWSPEIFLFREYGLKPNIVVLGKGFPGGEYASSRVLFSAALDNLPQFGALVTNGQEELASLVYLVTLRWAEENADVTRAVGDYYMERLNSLADAYPHLVKCIEGRRHMAGIFFKELDSAKGFASHLQNGGIDISVQAYKEGCPPCALTKLPLTAGYEVIDFLTGRMEDALKRL